MLLRLFFDINEDVLCNNSLASLALLIISLLLSIKCFSSSTIGSDLINAYNISLLDQLLLIFLSLAILFNVLLGNLANLSSFTKSLSDIFFVIKLLNPNSLNLLIILFQASIRKFFFNSLSTF